MTNELSETLVSSVLLFQGYRSSAESFEGEGTNGRCAHLRVAQSSVRWPESRESVRDCRQAAGNGSPSRLRPWQRKIGSCSLKLHTIARWTAGTLVAGGGLSAAACGRDGGVAVCRC